MTGDYGETGVAGFHYRFDGALVHEERSAFQHIEVYENPAFGRVLLLDGLVQTTERDEFCYHEMLVHVPLLIHPDPKRVLVIGGGDGGTLRHVLMHPGVERAVMIEIDERVTVVCRETMPSLGGEVWSDPRGDVRFADGIAFIHETGELFDAIIIDSSDPVGPGEGLFTDAFYTAARSRLAPGGVLTAQAGGVNFHQAELQRAHAAMAAAFSDVRLYLGNVPTYPGTGWSYLIGGAATLPSTETVTERFSERKLDGLRYFSPALVPGAFALPGFVQQILESGQAEHLYGPTPEEARRMEQQNS